MGFLLFDQYTLLHGAVGVMSYFWGISFVISLIIHTVFEIIENTTTGMRIINMITLWPGGKPFADAMRNRVGDTIGFILGWVFSYYLDKYGKQHWYQSLKNDSLNAIND